jgi:hypothetical protein
MNEILFETILSYSQRNGANLFIACNVVGISYSDFLTWAGKNKMEMLPMVRQLEQALPTFTQVENGTLNAGYLSIVKTTDVTTKRIYKKNESGEMELVEKHETTAPAKPNFSLINGFIANRFRDEFGTENDNNDNEFQVNIPSFETPNGETYYISE